MRITPAAIISLCVLLTGCADDGASPGAPDASLADAVEAADDAGTSGADAGTGEDADAADAEVGEPSPFAELEGIIDRYRGAALPVDERVRDTVTTYEFAVEDGPICLYGEPFRVAVRESDSDDLMIFLQGGGACWSSFCFAIDNAPPRMPAALDILDPGHETNPARDWDVVYVPYCDGSLFAGDVAVDTDGDGEIDRWQHGLRNLTAALDVAAARFPSPRRVMFAGSSGGGFGTIVAMPLARLIWPDAEMLVFNDAGVGVIKGDDPSFVDGIVDEFGARALIPASCSGCLDGGHMTPLVGWQLERDPNLRVAAFSTYGDTIISGIFLRLTASAFRAALEAETSALQDAFPGRYAAFLAEGTEHTALLGDISGFLGEDAEDSPIGAGVNIGQMDTIQVDGVTVATWFGWFVDGDERWTPVAE